MVTYRQNSGRSTGWFLALIFNGLLFLLPIIAARVVVIAFAGSSIGQAPTPEALTETRRNMEAEFVKMGPRSTDARIYWSSLIERELRARDLSAARGFLLAAPQMLNKDDVNAVRAAANAEVTGTEDERLARAALLFLPNSVRAKYEAASRPPSLPVPEPEPAAFDGEDGPEITPATEDAAEASPEPVRPVRPASATRATSFSVLGDLEDLAANSRRWVNGDERDSFVLRLTGLAALDPDTPPSVDLIEAASILKGAHRAGRITPEYLSILQARLNDVLPERDLRPNVETALAELAPMKVLGERVKGAFSDTYNPSRLSRLTVEIELINRISEATSPSGAISLIEHVEGVDDMRRARLVAEAGGDRASALVKEIGADTLRLARSGVQFTSALILQIMLLVAAAMALALSFAAVVQRSISNRPRKAAIY